MGLWASAYPTVIPCTPDDLPSRAHLSLWTARKATTTALLTWVQQEPLLAIQAVATPALMNVSAVLPIRDTGL